MNRGKRVSVAAETVAILDAGEYVSASGRRVSIGEAVGESVARTRVVAPEEWAAIVDEAAGILRSEKRPVVEVTGETTLAAARRMREANGNGDLLALTLRRRRIPGGGFLSGSQAKEESLARGSGLYKSLLAGQTYYVANRQFGSVLYTDHAILSPQVPVFREDDGAFLEEPWLVSFYTAPAPNRGALDEGSPQVGEIAAVFRRRMVQMFSLAALTGHRRLVLGAWGCGVFRNDPEEVAGLFAEVLFEEGWAGRFDHVCFAVFDTSVDHGVLGAFERVLGPFAEKEQR